MPDLPNPIGAVGSALGSAAANAATTALDETGQRVWQFSLTLLGGAFRLLDRYAAPDVNVTGPLSGLLPTTLWLGATIAMLLALLQLGKAMAAGGQGIGRLLIGLAQYAAITAGGLGFLGVLVSASDALATALLTGGLDARTFGALAGRNTFWQDTAQASGGLAMGLVALLCVIPAAFMLVVEALIRHAAILVLAATVPILAAGLVMDSTARWFWTGLRWMVALLLLTPAVALVMTIGMQGAQGSVGALSSDGPGGATVGMVVGGVTMLVALLCPLALFKLLAFLDPNTVSGGAVRGFLSGAGNQGTTSNGAALASGGSQGGDAATESRFGSQLSGVTRAGTAVADTASERGGQILDTAGVGHQGVSRGAARGGPGKQSDGVSGPGESGDWAPTEGGGGPDVGGPDVGGPDSGWVPKAPEPPTPPVAPAAGASPTPAAAGAGSGAAAAEEIAVVAL